MSLELGTERKRNEIRNRIIEDGCSVIDLDPIEKDIDQIVLYPGRNESGEFYQSEDGKTYCVVKSGAIVHNDKLIANAKFDGSTHEKGINAGLTDTSYSVVVSYEKNWIGGKLIDASEQSLYDAVDAVNKMNGSGTVPTLR